MPAKKVSIAHLRATLARDTGREFGPVLSPEKLAKLLDLKVKTIYVWLAAGRFDGCSRKRGKHILIQRDAALEQIFNGPNWSNEKRSD